MIICFSGTGNSAYVASTLASLLERERVVMLAGDALLRGAISDASADSRVVWVFPVYSWGVPPVIIDWIEKFAPADFAEKIHYCVLTCGDDVGKTPRQWRSIMHRRGWHNGSSVWSVIMPNNYVLMKGFDVDKLQLQQAKLDAALPRIRSVAEAIDEGRTDVTDVVKGSFAWFKSGVIRPWFNRYAMSVAPFHATGSCVGCGQCALGCPDCNITMVDHRPQWGSRCALCLHCYHVCPVHAVEYGCATADKGQYICPLK